MRQISIFITSIFLTLAPLSVQATPAAGLVGTCDYYQALSDSLDCDSQGYLLHFGAHYCWKFVIEEPAFSPAGQAILDRIRTCLQTGLENAPALTCANVESIAVATHFPCYIQSGFCNLSFAEQSVLGASIIPTLLNPQIEKTLNEIRRTCERRILLRHVLH
jgi:hypothetical protein